MESRKEEIREYYKQIKNCYFKETLNVISRNTDEIIRIIISDSESRGKDNYYIKATFQELLDYAKWNIDKWDNEKVILTVFPNWNNEGFKNNVKLMKEANNYISLQKNKSKVVYNKIYSKLKNAAETL